MSACIEMPCAPAGYGRTRRNTSVYVGQEPSQRINAQKTFSFGRIQDKGSERKEGGRRPGSGSHGVHTKSPNTPGIKEKRAAGHGPEALRTSRFQVPNMEDLWPLRLRNGQPSSLERIRGPIPSLERPFTLLVLQNPIPMESLFTGRPREKTSRVDQTQGPAAAILAISADGFPPAPPPPSPERRQPRLPTGHQECRGSPHRRTSSRHWRW